jgi:hypothetical protein
MVITGHRYSVTQESSNAEGGACLSVIRGAVVAQEARVCGVVPDDEVGAVVKAGITVTAQTEFVLFALRITLVLSQFDSWSVAGACHNTGSNCRSRGGIPVVTRKGSHRSSGVSDAGSTLCVKVFHFLDARPPHPTPPPTPPHHNTQHNHLQGQVIQTGHPDRSSRQVIQTGHPDRSSRQVIQTGHPDRSSRQVIQTGHPGQVTCQKHTELVFCF